MTQLLAELILPGPAGHFEYGLPPSASMPDLQAELFDWGVAMDDQPRTFFPSHPGWFNDPTCFIEPPTPGVSLSDLLGHPFAGTVRYIEISGEANSQTVRLFGVPEPSALLLGVCLLCGALLRRWRIR